MVINDQEMIPGSDTQLPYPVAQNNDELERNILEFDEDKYAGKMDRFEKDVELLFDGRASGRVADNIEYLMKQ